MVDFDDLVAGPLAEIFGDAARYRRPPFAWQPVRATRTTPSREWGEGRSEAFIVEIRAAELPDGATKGDEVDMGDGVIRTVESVDLDDLGITWRITLSEPVTA